MTNSKKVMVTGATGYIASWIVKYLLDEGYTVHAAIRNSSNEKKINILQMCWQILEGSFSAAFKTIFASEYSFCSTCPNSTGFVHICTAPKSEFQRRSLDGQKSKIHMVTWITR